MADFTQSPPFKRSGTTISTRIAGDDLVVDGDLTVNGSINFGDAGVDVLTIAGYLQGSATGNTYVSIGTGTPGNLGTPQTDDLYVKGRLEVDGTAYLDGGVTSTTYVSSSTNGNVLDFSGNVLRAQQNTDELKMALDVSTGMQWIFTAKANYTKDHDHAVQTNPKLFIHSATDPDTANDEWVSVTHDVTNAVFGLGSGAYTFPSGNVSIGSSAPTSSTLNVKGDNVFRLESVSGAVYFSVNTGVVSFNASGGHTEVAGSGDLGARMAISSLTTTGTALALTGISAQTGNIFEVNSIGDQSGDYMVVNKDGFVGIGAVTPTVPLHVKESTGTTYSPLAGTIALFQSNATTSTNARFAFQAGTAGEIILDFGDVNDQDVGGIKYNNTSNYLSFRTGGVSNRLLIDSVGNVGIGTDSPESLLNLVSGGTDTRPQIQLNAYNDQSDYSSSLIFKKSNSDTVGTLSETQNGDILGNMAWWGVNSGSAEAISGLIRVKQDGAAGATYIPSKIEFATGTSSAAAATVMTIDSDGVLDTTSGRTINRTAVGAATSSAATDHYFGCDAVGADTITIQTTDIAMVGRIFIVKDEGGNAATQNITIATEGAETIDGQATAVISGNYDRITLISDGSNLFII